MPLPVVALVAVAAAVAVVAASSSSSSTSTSSSSSAGHGLAPPRATPFQVLTWEQVARVPLEPLPRLPAYSPHENTDPRELPESSPSGARWLVWKGSRSFAPYGPGMDADGQWWTKFANSWVRVSEPRGAGALDTITEVVAKYVAPAVATMVGGLLGGVGGIAAGAALTAWSQLASGATIEQAVVGAVRDRLPSLIAGSAFTDAYKRAVATVPLEELAAARAKLTTEEQRTAWDSGLTVAAAAAAQASALRTLQASMPERSATIAAAVNNGAAVADIANVYGGKKGLDLIADVFRSEVGIDATGSPRVIVTGGRSCCAACEHSGTREGAPLGR